MDAPFLARLTGRHVPPAEAQRLRILIIGSERRSAILLREVGWEEHATIDVAPDASIGHTLITRGAPDLIILDPLVPGLDGPDVCRRIRADRVAAPLIMLSVLGTVEECMEALDSGADDYLVEPVPAEELRARLIALLRRRGQPIPAVSASGRW